MPLIDPAVLAHRFAHHPPTSPQVIAAHERVRQLCGSLADELNNLLPPCDEAKDALYLVDGACMMANAAIARHLNDREAAA